MDKDLYIKNDPNNNYCASIVFYQLARTFKGISFDDIVNYAKTLDHLDNKLRDVINKALRLLRPHLQPLYSKIQEGLIDVTELPKSGVYGDGKYINNSKEDARRSRKPLDSPFTDFGMSGDTLYGCISLFVRVMYAIQFGIWLNNIIPSDNIFTLPIDINIVNRTWNSYMVFITNHSIEDIPFVSYIGFSPDARTFENNGHVIICLYKEDGELIYFNNNSDELIMTNEIVILWVDEYNANTLHAFVTI